MAAFLDAIFDEIDPNCKLVVKSFVSDSNFEVVVRTKLECEENWATTCSKWVEKLSVQTNSKWRVKSSLATAQRMVYRKVYRCKDRNCKSRLDIKVKKITKHTLKTDKLLKTGLNVEVKIIFNHDHQR